MRHVLKYTSAVLRVQCNECIHMNRAEDCADERQGKLTGWLQEAQGRSGRAALAAGGGRMASSTEAVPCVDSSALACCKLRVVLSFAVLRATVKQLHEHN